MELIYHQRKKTLYFHDHQEKYSGYDYTVTNKDGKVTSTVVVDFKIFDMEQFIKDNVAMKKYTEKNYLTLDGAVKMYEASGATCK